MAWSRWCNCVFSMGLAITWHVMTLFFLFELNKCYSVNLSAYIGRILSHFYSLSLRANMTKVFLQTVPELLACSLLRVFVRTVVHCLRYQPVMASPLKVALLMHFDAYCGMSLWVKHTENWGPTQAHRRCARFKVWSSIFGCTDARM